MAHSKCPKCGLSFFELETESPKNSNYKCSFVRCASCKTVVGTLSANDHTIALNWLMKAVREIADHLGIYLDR